MKLRLSLFAQILGWFFLNLALLATVAWLVARSNFAFGLDSVLLAHGDSRVQALTDLVTAELRDRPRTDWDAILRRYSEAYGLDLRIYQNDGPRLAGTNAPLPAVVREKLLETPAIGGPRNGRPPADGDRRHPPEPRPPADWERRPPPAEPGPPFMPAASRSSPKFFLRANESPRYWLLTRALLPTNDNPGLPITLLAASDSIGFNGLLMDFRPWLFAAGAAALLSALFWFPFARAITRSVAQMTRTTGQIAEGRFDVRVATRRRDELGSLAASINAMAARLAGFVTGQKRFLGDVAHELCAPLARIQMALGILEQRADPGQKANLDDLREEVQHMSGLVNELLSFSKAGLKDRELELETVRLRPMVERVLSRETSATDRIEVDVPADVQVLGEPELVARAFANVVRNAIRYAGQAGPITITAIANGNEVLLTVDDCGPGVPEAILPQLGDPFFRPEESRSRETGGVGLGLAIVKSCVEACQGKLVLRNRQPTGLQVEMTFKSPR